MILTKEEFQKQFEYNSLPAVHRLIREGKIKARSDGMIDTEDSENQEFCQKRKLKIDKKNAVKPAKKTETKTANIKSADQLSLEIDILNSKLEERTSRVELLNIKIAKEKGQLIETDVLNRCIRMAFDDMIKSLTEFPNIYASEIIGIVKAEENPKEILVEYLTQKVTSSIKMGLENARQAAKKYYKG